MRKAIGRALFALGAVGIAFLTLVILYINTSSTKAKVVSSTVGELYISYTVDDTEYGSFITWEPERGDPGEYVDIMYDRDNHQVVSLLSNKLKNETIIIFVAALFITALGGMLMVSDS